MIDQNYLINNVFEFLELEYKNEINKIQLNKLSSLIIDFQKLAEYNPDIAEQLLESPQETKVAFEIATGNFSTKTGDIGNDGELGVVHQVHQVNRVHQVHQDLLFPPYLLSNSHKVLFLLSIVKTANQKELCDFFKIEKNNMSMIFSRKDRGTGLVHQGFGELVVNQNVVNSESQYDFYQITPSGLAYLQNLALQFEKNQQVPQETKVGVRFINLPTSSVVNISDIRSRHHKKFITIEGVIRRKSDVRPRAVMLRYECPTCGNIINIRQTEQHLKIPVRCSCGRKGKFKLLSKELKDIQHIVIEDLGLNSDLAEVKRLHTLLDNDLCDRQKDLQVGNRILLYGWIEEIPKEVAGRQLVDFDILFIVNNFKNLDDKKIALNEEDKIMIKEFASENGYGTLKKLTELFSPDIAGNDFIKKACLLQLVTKDVKGFKTRLRMHFHIVGTFGVGKTKLALFSHRIAPKSIFADVTHASGVGLTASVIKDEFLKTWALEAGAVALAGDGLVLLDEIDKQKKEEEISGLGEPMEKGTITVSKANIHQTLPAPAKILSCGNFSKDYNLTGLLDSDALCLKQHVVDRFDIILRGEDVDDDILGNKILSSKSDVKESDIDFLRKYIFYALNNPITLETSKEVNDELMLFFKKVRLEQQDSSLKFSPRLLESLLRLSVASAKLRLSSEIELFDAQVAISIIRRSLQDRKFWKKLEKDDSIVWEDLM